MSGKELPKIIEKSLAEIEAAIAGIESSNLSPDIIVNMILQLLI